MALLQIRVELTLLLVALVLGFSLDLCFGHQGHHHFGFGASKVHDHEPPHVHHHHNHQCGVGHGHGHLLSEELAEEESMRLFGFGLQHDHDHDHRHHYVGAPTELSGLAFNCINATRLRWVTDIEDLQIRKDGMWIPAQPLPNAFIINIGDTLEIVTNGIFGSIEHRATVNLERREGEGFHSHLL